MNTTQRRNERRTNWLQEHGPCQVCGSTKDLHIHHEDPSQKVSSEVWTWSKERRDKELLKCIVVCNECHKDIHVKLKREGGQSRYHKDRKLIECKQCKRLRPPKGKGLCDSCYREHQRQSKIIICKVCGKEKHPYTKETCNACFSKQSRQKPNQRRLIECKICGEKQYHEGHGMCKKCYIKDYYQSNKNKIICKICKEEKKHHSKGLCSKCYMRKKRKR